MASLPGDGEGRQQPSAKAADVANPADARRREDRQQARQHSRVGHQSQA